MTKAKMPVIICLDRAAGQAVTLGLWTARQISGVTSTRVIHGGCAA